jgi:hypothetical protein
VTIAGARRVLRSPSRLTQQQIGTMVDDFLVLNVAAKALTIRQRDYCRAMKNLTGDLLKLAIEGRFDVIVHGANCQCVMGAGIAKAIRLDAARSYHRRGA